MYVKADWYFTWCSPDDGRFVVRNGVKLHNDMVVPYNPSLLLKHDCHFNVEIVSTIHSVKYLFKYVYEGHDKAMMRMMRRPYHQYAAAPEKNPDEVERYLECRCSPTISVTTMLAMLFNDDCNECHHWLICVVVYIVVYM